ncbi:MULTISPECIES: type IV pilin protein [unclassified Flavobacterium]|uniref:type IV pilin protein n=1 Tax=unclassified Flavobacterium TaxID=196869 RepID=UPI001F1348CC|nr:MULTISPECIES: type II secretion system protein [unclassified Flavobacterium]UMY66258.1 type II secretion system GspH family protein [Flavobacterium sp. HJ-32-4]
MRKFYRHPARRNPAWRVRAYSMTEILIVLCIIGIILLMVLPNQTSVISQAKSIEAQAMLNQVYGLEKSYFYRYSKYTSNLEELGFEQEQTVDQGGQAVYKIEIAEATNNGFLARATSVSDLDGDGAFNTWEIDDKKILTETNKE